MLNSRNMKTKMTKKTILFCVLSSLSIAFMACQSSKFEVSNEATSREIIQKAQSAYDSGHPNQAISYYQILLQRYGMDTATYIEGRYEIAHIYVKQKKYLQAKPILEEIIEIYNGVQPGVLPGSFKKLAVRDYEKITAKKDSSLAN